MMVSKRRVDVSATTRRLQAERDQSKVEFYKKFPELGSPNDPIRIRANLEMMKAIS